MIRSAAACPFCYSRVVYRSRSPVRPLARLVMLHPVRCGHCERRFWGFGVAAPPPRPSGAGSTGVAPPPPRKGG